MYKIYKNERDKFAKAPKLSKNFSKMRNKYCIIAL